MTEFSFFGELPLSGFVQCFLTNQFNDTYLCKLGQQMKDC